MSTTVTKDSFVSRHKFGLAIFSSVFLFVIASCGLVVANGQTIRPDDSHIVNVYVDGREDVLPTRAQTVGELVAKLPISINPADVIEPNIKTPIDGDNFRVQILRATPTTIIDGDNQLSLMSPYDDLRFAVEQAGFKLAPEDLVRQEFASDIVATRILGRKIVIDRAYNVTVNLYGSPFDQKTRLKTVSELLALMNIKPAKDDTVQPSPDTPLSEGMKVFITKYGKQVLNVEEPIAFTTETTEDANASAGSKKITQTGSVGKKVVTYELELQNGAEVSRHPIQESIITAAVVQKVTLGTKPLFADYNADGIPARVYCGSPKQGNWKNINVGNAAAGRTLAAERGWTGTEFNALLELFACESSWNEKAGNPFSGAYGIPQSLPASKMASFGDDYETNPVTQLRWGLNYIAARYGTPSAALAFHYRNNYY